MTRKPWHPREDADPVVMGLVQACLPALDAWCASRPPLRLRVRMMEGGVVTHEEVIVVGGATAKAFPEEVAV